ncbi:unnamed protein product [Soboliphyme baturini]|uniref:NRF domain-containing protein n=1 Tax=Soboliphyme baturini TaxID=241478 RepID=A0A183J0P8_9BILA|nr:unnamed protein product [Soboliphyme baturini]
MGFDRKAAWILALWFFAWSTTGSTEDFLPEVLEKLKNWNFRWDSVELLQGMAVDRGDVGSPLLNLTLLLESLHLSPELLRTLSISDKTNYMQGITSSLMSAIKAHNEADQTCLGKATDRCPCAERVSQLLDSFSWAFSALDATGKLPSGILRGDLWMLGDYVECNKLRVRTDSG